MMSAPLTKEVETPPAPRRRSLRRPVRDHPPGEFSFWNVQTLEPRLQLEHQVLYPSRVAFSPDQKLMALEMAPGVVHLLEIATGATIARLENPSRDRATWIDFTADGTQLIVAARNSKTVHVWDLARVRAGLKPLGLDRQWPEFTAHSRTNTVAQASGWHR